MKAALKRGVETGTLVQVKASYKLSADAKKKSTSKPKATTAKKAAPKKKTAPKKKVSSIYGDALLCDVPVLCSDVVRYSTWKILWFEFSGGSHQEDGHQGKFEKIILMFYMTRMHAHLTLRVLYFLENDREEDNN